MGRALLVLLVGALIGANVVYYLMTRTAPPVQSSWPASHSAVPVSAPAPAPERLPVDRAPDTLSSEPAPSGMPSMPDAHVAPAPADAPASALPATPSSTIEPPDGLIVPVAGVPAAQLRDTFTDARGVGRVHDAIDIMADTGTPVVAVADGSIEKLFTSAAGGLTIYQFEPSGRFAYYYAHLDRYAPGIAEKNAVRQGDLIGYVGSTGNADPAAPHLHFAIFALGAERQWWKGEAINPYPILRAAR